MGSKVIVSNQEYNVVGSRPIRHDGLEKVTGQAKYSADIHLPGMLHGRILRSPHAHAIIRSINTEKALRLEGVKSVITAYDLPQMEGMAADLGEGAFHNLRFVSNNCMAFDKVLYKGHAVAAVAAITPYIAEEALSLIEIDYEELPAVLDVLEAMNPGSPILHPALRTMSDSTLRTGGLGPEDNEEPTNISNRFVHEIGDVEKGFMEANLVVERDFRTGPVHQGYIEPHSATALWHPDGELTIWCSSQGHFGIRDMTAAILGIPQSKIKVVPMEIGGGFGGKLGIYLEPVTALLSKKSGQPVKITMSRAEVFEGTGPTSGSFIRVKMGVTNKGKITAAEGWIAYEAGAFPGSPIVSGTRCLLAPYDIPNARVEGFDVVVNKPKSAAYRAPGSPAAAFAAESVVDEIAIMLDIDPIELRIINGASEGTRQIWGGKFPRIGYLETLEAAKSHEHYSTPLEGPWRGRGIASGYWMNASGPSCVHASVNADGTVNLVEGSPDIGGTRTSIAMQFAEALGIDAHDVKPTIGDTASVGYTSVTGGSSVTFKTGWAAYEAAQDIKRQMIDRASLIWDVSPDQIELCEGTFCHKSDSGLQITFKQLAGRLNETGGPIVGRANLDPGGAGPAFAVHVVDLEVDPETGKVEILRYTALQDVGKAIHPSYVEGQIQGGVAQGIGWALNEEYFFGEKGNMANPTFLDYRMPTALDLPMIDTVIIEVSNPRHPFGVRGVGEVCIVPPLAAISNALYRAIGVRLQSLPMSPGKILEALWGV